MGWIQFVCILVVFCGTAWSAKPIRAEDADHLSPPPVSLVGSGLDLAATDDIHSDLTTKRFSEAEAKLIGRIGTVANPQGLLEVLGGVFFLDANYLQAAIALKRAENYGVLSENARFTLVMSYIELMRLKWARDELARLINKKPEQPLYHYWLGRLDYDDQKFAQAIVSFSRAIEIDTRFTRAYDGKALCDEAMGNTRSAEQAYLRANLLNRAQGSRYAWPPLDYGAMLAKLGRYGEATSLLNEALTIDPSLAKAHYELGRVEEHMSRSEEAIQDFAVATRLDPNDPSPVYALFRLYTRTGKKQLAAAMMARFRALKAMPTSNSSASESRASTPRPKAN